jgi:hypothetical protein
MEFVDKIKKGDSKRDGKVNNPDHLLRMLIAADADHPSAKIGIAELLKAPTAAAEARDFSASEFRCIALQDHPGSQTQAALAHFWAHGYLAGAAKAQNKLAFAADDDGAAAKTLEQSCQLYGEAFLLTVAGKELTKTPPALAGTTAVFAPASYTCKDYLAARNGGNADQADMVDLWGFAFLQGYKNVGQPNMEIPFQARAQLMGAVARACATNLDMGYPDLASLVAAKVKLK